MREGATQKITPACLRAGDTNITLGGMFIIMMITDVETVTFEFGILTNINTISLTLEQVFSSTVITLGGKVV